MSHRWMKFWPGDWKGDAALRMCGLAARGLWIECIAIMHEATPYGHLLVNGKALSPKQVASIVGSTERDVVKLLAELEDAGVFSRTAEGTIYSRRMLRDHERSEEGRTAIAKRWANKGEADEPTSPPTSTPIRPPGSLETEAEEEKKELSVPSEPHPSGKPPGPSRPKPKAMAESFAEFWRHYPRKVGKGAALRAWDKAVREAQGDIDAIIGGLKVAASLGELDMREDGRFCPHPATWLNGQRWLDGLDVDLPSNSSPAPRH